MPTIESHIGNLANARLATKDYVSISNFFKGSVRFTQLSIEQRRILDSFHLRNAPVHILDSRLTNELISKQDDDS